MSENEKATPLGFVRISELRTRGIHYLQYQQDFINKDSKVYTLRKNYSNAEMTLDQMQENFKGLYDWYINIAIIEQEEKDLPEDEQFVRKLLRRFNTGDIFHKLMSSRPLRDLAMQERRISLSSILRVIRPLDEAITIKCLEIGIEVQTKISKFVWSKDDNLATQEGRTLAVIALHLQALRKPKISEAVFWSNFE